MLFSIEERIMKIDKIVIDNCSECLWRSYRLTNIDDNGVKGKEQSLLLMCIADPINRGKYSFLLEKKVASLKSKDEAVPPPEWCPFEERIKSMKVDNGEIQAETFNEYLNLLSNRKIKYLPTKNPRVKCFKAKIKSELEKVTELTNSEKYEIWESFHKEEWNTFIKDKMLIVVRPSATSCHDDQSPIDEFMEAFGADFEDLDPDIKDSWQDDYDRWKKDD